MFKKTASLILVLSMAISMGACGKKEEEVTVESTPVVESADPVEVPVEEEETGSGVYSYLTGEEFSQDDADDYGNLRPLAIMIPNDNYGALPQYGLSKAGVIYEVPVEAPYTRLMAVFDRAELSKLESVGPVRSCRLYYCYFDLEYDGIYTHFGESEYATSFLSSGQIDEIDGMTDESAFWRDSSRSRPDNAFTSSELLESMISSKGFRNEYSDDYEGHFKFADKDSEVTLNDGDTAETVKIGYQLSAPWFEYNQDDGLYYRYEYNSEHTDAATGEQLTCKNILIQSVSYYMEASHGTYHINTTDGQEGYYITNGKAIHVTWSKASESDRTIFYDDAGNEITLNPGKTWISIVLNDKFSDVSIGGGSSE